MIEQETLLLNPFPGLRPFGPKESEVFFGRDGQSDQVLTKLRTARFVAVVGTSGSGKSSLVAAGLLPALLSGHMPSAGSRWRIANFRPGSNPISNLAEALSAPEVSGVKDEAGRSGRREYIESTLRRSSLGLLEIVSQSKLAPGENLLVLADQFEELFRFRKQSTAEHPADEAAAFVKLLLEAKQSEKKDEEKLPIYVILTMRSDYLGDCAHFWGLPEAINEGQFLIPRMTDDNRREAIIGPVIIGGGEITAPLVNRLLNDAGDDPAQLPILQHALMRTWDHWKNRCNASGPIDISHYEAIGGMAKALSNHADEAFVILSRGLRVIAAKVFKSLTEKEADNREGRRPATIGEIAAAAEVNESAVVEVVDSFRAEGCSFLMPSPPAPLNSDTPIDISHESLIRGWDRLREWVDEEADAGRQYIRLADKAALYPKDEPPLGEPALSNALKWLDSKPTKAWAERYHPGFDKTILFIQASKTIRDEALAEKERLHKEKVEQDLRHAKAIAAERGRRVKQQRWGLALLSLLLILMFGATVYAFWQKSEADRQRDSAKNALGRAETERKSALEARTEADKERDRANVERQNAVDQKTVAEKATDEADRQKGVAVGALASARTAADKALKAAGVAKDAKDDAEAARAKAEDVLKTIKEIDLSQPYAKAAMRDSKQAIKSVAVSPDGQYIVTASGEEYVKIYKAPSGESLITWSFDGLLTSVAFSHDSKFIAAAGDKGLGRWNVKEQWGQTHDTVDKGYSSVVFSPDDKIIAAISYEKERLADDEGYVEIEGNLVELWNPSSKEKPKILSGHTGRINTLTFSPKGKYLVTTSDDKTARVWNPVTGMLITELGGLRGHQTEVTSADFSPDETLVVTAGNDRTAHIWDSATGEILVSRTLSDELTELLEASGLSFEAKAAMTASLLSDNPSPAAKAFLAGSSLTAEQKAVRLQDSRLNHDDPVSSVRFSPNGKYIVTTSGNNAYLWAPESPSNWAMMRDGSPMILKGHEKPVKEAVFSPDSRWVVTIGEDQLAQLWRAEIPKATPGFDELNEAASDAVFRGHTKPLTSVALTNDYVVTGSDDKTTRVWGLAGIGAFSVASASLRPERPEYKGKCPLTIRLTGKINVIGKGGTVKYRLVRSAASRGLK